MDVYLFVYKYPIIPVPFVEKDILSPLNYVCIFEKNQLIIPLNFFFCKPKTTQKIGSINYFKIKINQPIIYV